LYIYVKKKAIFVILAPYYISVILQHYSTLVDTFERDAWSQNH